MAGEDGRISLTFTDTAPYQSATFKITALEDATEDIDIDIKGSFDDPISTVAYKGGSRTETLTFLGAVQEIYVSAYVFCDKESNLLTNKKRNFVTKFRFLLIFWLKPLDFTEFLMSHPLFALVKRFCLIFWCFYDIVKIEKFKKFCNFCNLCIIFLVY